MKYLGYVADADGILLWFPSQNRTFSVPKPYVFGSETVRFWDGERKRTCLTNYRVKSKTVSKIKTLCFCVSAFDKRTA